MKDLSLRFVLMALASLLGALAPLGLQPRLRAPVTVPAERGLPRSMAGQAGADNGDAEAAEYHRIYGLQHLGPVAAQLQPFGSSSVVFQANRGQAEPEVQFLTRTGNYLLELAPHEVRVWPRRGQQAGPDSPMRDWERPAKLRMSLVGASPRPRISGRGRLPAQIHYLRGSDPEKWRPNVALYSEVVYEGIYPGIDLVFYGNPALLEFDFQVAAGSDPSLIRMRWDGAERIDLGPGGDLILESVAGALRLQRPLAFQPSSGFRRVPVSFLLMEEGQVGFELGAFDPGEPLVVDPVLLFSSYLGGAQEDAAIRVAVDAGGNSYVAGYTEAVNFPTGSGAFQQDSAGGRDVFLSKFDSDGRLVYSTYIGGEGGEIANDVAMDATGNAYLAGATSSRDFPTTAGASTAVQPEYGGGNSDGFLLKLNRSGSALVFSTFVGGARDDEVRGLSVDPQGSVSIAGFTNSQDFPVFEALQGEIAGGFDAFSARYNAAGTAQIFSTYLGGLLDDVGQAVAFGPDGSLIVAGYTLSRDFPVAAPFQEERRGGQDAFLARLLPDGSDFLFSTYLGSSGLDTSYDLEVDGDGNCYLAGDTTGRDFPTRNALQSSLAGSADAFVTKMTPGGDALVYSTYIGGSGADSIRALRLDGFRQVHVSGATASSDFPLAGALLVNPDDVDSFVSKLGAEGSSLLFSTYLPGTHREIASGLGLDASGNLYAVGSVDLPGLLTLNPFQANFGGRGVFRSLNRTQNWQSAGSGLDNPNILSLAVHPSDGSILYAGTAGSGVYWSDDGGSSWSVTGLDAGQVLSLAFDPSEPSTLWAGTSFTVFKTIDGGENWEPANERLPLFAAFATLAVDPEDPSILYTGTATRGVFKSTNGGQSWRAINNGLLDASQQIFDLAIDPSDSSRLYLATRGTAFTSGNGGSTWVPTSLGQVDAVTALAVDPVDTVTVYAGAFSGEFGNLLAKTADGGVNWRAVPVEGTVSALVIDPANRSRIYAATLGAGVLKSMDGGTVWQPANTGLGSLRVNALAANSSGSSLYAGTDSGSDGFMMKVAPTRIFYFPQIGDGVTGQIRFQTTLILVNAGEETLVKVDFFDSSHNPLQVALGSLGTGSSFEIPLTRGAAFSAQTPGEGALKLGYARIMTSGAVGGTAVFTRSDRQTGLILYETGVPASDAVSDFSLLLDSIGDRDSGAAVVNAASGLPDESDEAEIELTLFDRDTNFVAETTRNLERGHHFAQFISEMFPEIVEQVGETQGTLFVTTNRPLAAVSLRQNENPRLPFPRFVPTLTALPVILPHTRHAVTYFPQIGDGAFLGSRFQTSFLLANGGFFNENVTVEFFDSGGQPLNLELEDRGSDSSFQVPVAAGSFVVLRTAGGDELQVGYARITSAGGGVSGIAVFSETESTTGVLLYEAGVPASTPLSEFSLFVDTLGIRDTGLALVNPDQVEASVTLRLHDSSFNLLSEVTLTLQPGEHRAQFVPSLFPSASRAREMQGVLTVASDQPLVVVTLRQRNDLTRVFPQKVPTLTAFPVIPGRAR